MANRCKSFELTDVAAGEALSFSNNITFSGTLTKTGAQTNSGAVTNSSSTTMSGAVIGGVQTLAAAGAKVG